MIKRLIIIAVVLGAGLFTRQAHADLFVASSSGIVAASNTTVTSTINAVQGDFLFVGCKQGTNGTSVATVTDTTGSSFTDVVDMKDVANTVVMSGYWAFATSSNANDIITCTWSGNVINRFAVVMEYTRVATSNTFDTSTSAFFTTNTSLLHATFTTQYANELVVSYGDSFGSSNITSTAPFTMRFGGIQLGAGAGGMDYQPTSIQGPTTAGWTIANTTGGLIVATFQVTAPVSTPKTYYNDIPIYGN